ncbi:MAG TPA: hypothetical protein VGY54_03995 [Polyangiaceae bacterium]|jgi:hypothetical protein|nr:hypothetical protein [Polyangiaceae bacterium]
MSGFPVYVAAPYSLAPTVRAIHEELARVGCHPTSQWARLADGTLEQLDRCSPAELESAIELNDLCIDKSMAMVVVSPEEPKGGETFAEVGRALALRLPVLWTGSRRILSSYRKGVFRVDLSEALRALAYAAAGSSDLTGYRVAKTRLFGWFADWPIAERGIAVAR